MRRHFLIFFILSALLIPSCRMYRGEIDYYTELARSIDENLFTVQSSIETYNFMLELVRNNDFVREVTPIEEDSQTVGYYLVFSKGEKLAIYFGKDGQKGDPGRDGEDGANGRTPVVEILEYTDGKRYWSVNGFFLLDQYGDMIPAEGGDGICPVVKLDGKIWMVSYDNGASWSPLGSSVLVSVSIFRYVEVTGGGTVEIYLQDGEVISIPTYQSIKIDLENSRYFECGETQKLEYSIGGVADENADIELSYTVSSGWKARIVKASNTSGTLEVTAPDEYQSNASLIFFASSDGRTVSSSQKLSMYEPGPEINLSKTCTSNCYIVSKPHRYCFNGSVKGESKESIGNACGCRVIWESFGTDTRPDPGDVVSNVSYEGEYVHFTSASDGNAVIAAVDAEENILWSWHIWVCEDFDPEATSHTYYNKAGIMMDRNLGALSAEPGNLLAKGLQYQWGRKDPFPGPDDSPDGSECIATTLDPWPDPVMYCNKVSTCISNPTTYYKSSYGDWLLNRDNRLWAHEKTVYDPCPYGWRVPDGDPHEDGVWAVAAHNFAYMDGFEMIGNEFKQIGGVNFGKNSEYTFGDYDCIYYPLSGSRWFEGELREADKYGEYWSCTGWDSGSACAYCFSFEIFENSVTIRNSSHYRVCSFPVRCMKLQ